MNTASINKPYDPDHCVHGIDVTLCGMVFTLRTDSRPCLDAMRRHFLGSASHAAPGATPELICHCATRCEAPWVMAIETSDGLHLARPHRCREASFEFDEWTPTGCRAVGESWPTSPPGGAMDDAGMNVLTTYVRKRLLRALINRRSPANLRILHAAALQHGTKGILVLGDSQSGKSTLTLAASLAGMRYLAEESAIVDLGEGMILPLPTPFRLREGTLALSPAFRRLPREAITDMLGDVRWLVDPNLLAANTVGTPVRLSHVLLLRDRTERPRLAPVSGADLARTCVVADLFSGTNDAIATLWQWTERLQRTHTACLHPGPLDETVALVKSWVDESVA